MSTWAPGATGCPDGAIAIRRAFRSGRGRKAPMNVRCASPPLLFFCAARFSRFLQRGKRRNPFVAQSVRQGPRVLMLQSTRFQEGCRRFCCPARLRTAGIRFCYRVRPEPCSSVITRPCWVLVTLQSQMPSYRWHLSVLNGLTAHSRRAKTPSLSTRLSWFGPVMRSARPISRPVRSEWWSRRVLPPGPLHLLYAAIYRHIRLPDPADIARPCLM